MNHIQCLLWNFSERFEKEDRHVIHVINRRLRVAIQEP